MPAAGFEPTKPMAADLQSACFAHLHTLAASDVTCISGAHVTGLKRHFNLMHPHGHRGIEPRFRGLYTPLLARPTLGRLQSTTRLRTCPGFNPRAAPTCRLQDGAEPLRRCPWGCMKTYSSLCPRPMPTPMARDAKMQKTKQETTQFGLFHSAAQVWA